MNLIQGSGNNPNRDRWVWASGAIIGEHGGPCHLAATISLMNPPQLGVGIRLADVEIESLEELEWRGKVYWAMGPYEVMGFIDDGYVLHAKTINRVPSKSTHHGAPTGPA